MIGKEPYPYNLPPWRRSHEALSPDGQWCAKIDNALELFMSGPTTGTLSINTEFDIPDCSPVFIWSDDSRYLAVPQWKYFFLKRERLLVIDTHEKSILASPSKYKLLDLKTFSNGVITGVDSVVRNPRKIAVSIDKVMKEFEKIEHSSKLVAEPT